VPLLCHRAVRICALTSSLVAGLKALFRPCDCLQLSDFVLSILGPTLLPFEAVDKSNLPFATIHRTTDPSQTARVGLSAWQFLPYRPLYLCARGSFPTFSTP
jgi:hypothetical protein